MFLSNKPLQKPCITTRAGSSQVVSCRPRADLGRNGVLVVWSALARLGLKKGDPFVGAEGDRVAVDGRPAVLDQGKATGWCRAVGGTRQILAFIWIARRSEDLVMDACAAHLTTKLRAESLASLYSVRI